MNLRLILSVATFLPLAKSNCPDKTCHFRVNELHIVCQLIESLHEIECTHQNNNANIGTGLCCTTYSQSEDTKPHVT